MSHNNLVMSYIIVGDVLLHWGILLFNILLLLLKNHFQYRVCFYSVVLVKDRSTSCSRCQQNTPRVLSAGMPLSVSTAFPTLGVCVAARAARYFGWSPLGDALLTSLWYPPLSSPHQTLASSPTLTHSVLHTLFSHSAPSAVAETPTSYSSSSSSSSRLPVRTAAGPHEEGFDSSCH